MSDAQAIWVQSDVLPDGTYVTAIHYDDDQSRILDRAAGLAYVAEVFTAAVHAEHDAAVVRQLTGLGLDLESAARAIAELRADRPPLADAVTAPLRLVPGVSAKTGNGFLHIHLGEVRVGQWDPDDARDHATNVLSVLAAADLDAAYCRYLVGTVGIGLPRAQAVVGDLGNYVQVAGDD